MVRVPISIQDRLNFVDIDLKPAARADEDSLVNQCSHKIDFSLHSSGETPSIYLTANFPTRRVYFITWTQLCLPSSSVNMEEVLAEFEVLYAQFVHHKSQPVEQTAALRVRLGDPAHAYCGSPIDIGDFLMTKEAFQAVKSLQSNNAILITKLDKCADVVILNKHDHISKMDTLLHDVSKFENLGPASQNDNTAKIESPMQRRLLELKKKNLIPTRVFEAIRPTGSQRSRMYGLSKIYKKDVPPHPVHDWLSPT